MRKGYSKGTKIHQNQEVTKGMKGINMYQQVSMGMKKKHGLSRVDGTCYGHTRKILVTFMKYVRDMQRSYKRHFREILGI